MQNVLSLDALRALDAIERKGSFAAAAEVLFKVPSALSYTIAKLESELGVSLFDRSKQKAQLTPAGQLLLQQGRQILLASRQLEEAVRQLDTGWEPKLTIAVESLVPWQPLFALVDEFGALGKMTQVALREEVMAGSWEALQTGRADLAVGLTGDGVSGQFHLEPMAMVDFVFAVAPYHPLSRVEQPVQVADLVSQTAIVLADSAIDMPRRDSGLFDSRRRVQVNSMAAKIAAHKAGLGVGFLPRHLIQDELAEGSLVAKMSAIPRAPAMLYVGWRKNQQLGEAAKWFSQRLSQVNWGAVLQSAGAVGEPSK